MSNPYSKFQSAEVMGVRQYIEVGTHRLLVKRTEMGPSKNPQKKNMEKTVVEFKIIESSTMKVGESCSLVETDEQAGYYGNVKAFVAGILGNTIDEMTVDPDFNATFAAIFETDQILTGFLVDCVAQQVGTTKGGEYTAKSWEAVPASEYGQYNLIVPEGAYEPPEAAAAA